ncbi:MAG: hypothetical protein IPM01_27600 [Burkholderiaceae bacterium]|nr:hypothetical protein [Burkholderiaceae bacterium]
MSASTHTHHGRVFGGLQQGLERSAWIAERAFAQRPFASDTALLLALWGVVRSASPRNGSALLNAHPELARQGGPRPAR